MYLGIAGVDDPYPKEVQDALDLVERETRRYTTQDKRELKRLWADDVARQQRRGDEKFWETRSKQQAAQQKKRPYQQVDRADQWPSW